MGHSHFGQECYGPGSGDLTNPPVSSMLSSSAAQASPATTTKESKEESKSHGSSGIHKCESCSKVYRHPSCLVKHRWVSFEMRCKRFKGGQSMKGQVELK